MHKQIHIIYIQTYIYIYIHTYIYVYTSTHTYTNIYIHILYIHTYIWLIKLYKLRTTYHTLYGFLAAWTGERSNEHGSGFHNLGVLTIRALPCGVHVRVPDFCRIHEGKLPFLDNKHFNVGACISTIQLPATVAISRKPRSVDSF